MAFADQWKRSARPLPLSSEHERPATATPRLAPKHRAAAGATDALANVLVEVVSARFKTLSVTTLDSRLLDGAVGERRSSGAMAGEIVPTAPALGRSLSVAQRKPPLPTPPRARARRASLQVVSGEVKPPTRIRSASLRRSSGAPAPANLMETARRSSLSASARRRPPVPPTFNPPRSLSAVGFGGEYAAAADAILRCDYLLIAAGAGFSADSGLAVYKDIANVPAYRLAHLSYADLCSPRWLAEDPSLFFGFWGACFNTYMETQPHAGYAILARWRDQIIGRRAAPSAAQSSARPQTAAVVQHSRGGPGSQNVPLSRRRQSFAAAAAAADAARGTCELAAAAWAAPAPLGSGAPAGGASGAGGAAGSAADCAVAAHSSGAAARALSASSGRGGLQSVFVYTSNVDTAFSRAGFGGSDGADDDGETRASGGEGAHEGSERGGWAGAQAAGQRQERESRGQHGCGRQGGLYEIHGNIRTWQCSAPCARSRSGEGDGTWLLPSDHRFAVEMRTMRAPAFRSAATPSAPTSASAPAEGGADECVQGETAAAETPRERNHPCCAHCGRLARPAILMFDDSCCIETRPSAYKAWESRVGVELRKDASKRLVILEGGCGLRVPTVRRNSERVLKSLGAYGTRLIRLNLDHPNCRQSLAHSTVPIRARCLPALELIDRAISARLAQSAESSASAGVGPA